MSIVVFTGAGVSRESGLLTFRDADGLWEGHRIEDVCTVEAWNSNRAEVLEFYNKRRREVIAASPNPAHLAIAGLSDAVVITQNVDDLHERAGSAQVIHLHGEIRFVREDGLDERIPWDGDVRLGDVGPNGRQLRPHVVWFGEAVEHMGDAAWLAKEAEALLVVGTSLNVFPAAGLVDLIPRTARLIVVDPNPPNLELGRSVEYVRMNASEGVPVAVQMLQGG